MIHPNDPDTHGSHYRRMMMEIHKDPAGFRPLNRRQEPMPWFHKFVAVAAVLCLSVAILHTLYLAVAR